VLIFTIAWLTVLEVIRRRLALAVGVLTIVAVAMTAWGFYKLTTLTDRTGHPPPHAELLLTVSFLVIFIAYMFSVILAIGAAFLGAPALAADVESGIALAILPRPIQRWELVLGKWLGSAAMLIVFAAGAAAVELAMVQMVTGYSPPHPALAVLFLAGQSLVVLTFTMLCSSRLAPVTSGIVALVLFGLVWIAGFVGMVGEQFGNRNIIDVTTAISLVLPTDGLWRGAVYNLEPAAVIAAMQAAAGDAARAVGPFAVGSPPLPSYLIWACCWVAGVLGATMASFSKRDL
jgi:ABC-type transport system involved in multi-copper enzyme maturation permease subunit